MLFNYRYSGNTTVSSNASSTGLSFVPDALRQPTYFSGSLNRKDPFREAISALHDVVISDLRVQPRDKTAYKEWAAQQEAVWMAEIMAESPDVSARLDKARGELTTMDQQRAKIMQPFYAAQQKYFRWLYKRDLDAWYVLDPVITVHSLKPGEPVTVVFEPWNLEVPCPRSIYHGTMDHEVRIWGRRRLLILERLIPVAKRFQVTLLGSGMPSFYVADLGDMNFTLGLSGWTANDWSRAGNFDLMAPRKIVEDHLKLRVFEALQEHWCEEPGALARRLGLETEEVLGALGAWTQAGRAIYDLNKKVYRIRELSREPLPMQALRFSSEQEATASRLVETSGAVQVQAEQLHDILRVKGLFRALGYREKVATVLGLLCTEPETDELELDGQRWFVHASERRLPQGAPTSPAITNILCYRLDRRLSGMAAKLGFTYTRYADDLTFSASGEPARDFRKLLWRSQSIVESEGFNLHPDKLRIMRRGRRQEVTGLTVNDGVSVPRRDLREFRALLYQIEKDGPGGKKWRGSERHLLAAVRGYGYFIRMVDEEKGERFVNQVKTILAREGWSHEIRHHPKPKPKPTGPPPLPEHSKGGPKKKKSFFEKLMFWKRD